MYNLEEFDRQKTKVLKYVLFKKRTETEVRTKFRNIIEDNMLEDIIQILKDNRYIDDTDYIRRCINEYIALRNLSIKELKYKIISKGIDIRLLEDYIYKNIEELEDYEKKSAENIVLKKSINMDEQQIKQYLIKKGYKQDNIKEAIEKIQ